MGYDLSILMPSRNEIFTAKTIENVLANSSERCEIICVLDGQWPPEPIPQHPRVTVVYLPKSIGQRAATNVAARLSKAKYVMKLDSHCSLGQGFDEIMMADMQDDWVMVPTMYNLHAFDWVCPDGHRRYQGPSGVCKDCGKPTKMDILWKAKPSPETTSMRFDRDLKFQYWGEYKKQQKGDLVETMSLLGACWMVTREKYWEWKICDENHGSWGQQGTEVACKGWMSGGAVMVTKKTWFAHMFRTQGGDFGFPYPISGGDVDRARKYSKDLWFGNKWDKAVHDLDWLIKKFNPPDWISGSKGIVYYTDGELAPALELRVQEQIKKAELPIVSVSLKPIQFGKSIHMNEERGVLTMTKQILAGLEASDSDIIFYCEHDCLYSESHFSFVPPKKELIYYNTNVWKINTEEGYALRVDDCRQLSGLCAYRDVLIKHYKARLKRIEAEGYSNKIGFEPGTHSRKERIDDLKSATWESSQPNLDIRTKHCLTKSRWKKEEFRNQKYTEGWQTATELPYWGHISDVIESIK